MTDIETLAKQIGDAPAFPVMLPSGISTLSDTLDGGTDVLNADSKAIGHTGMTYRQWLYGQVLQGILSKRFDEPQKNVNDTISDTLKYVQQSLEAQACEQLQEEVNNGQ